MPAATSRFESSDFGAKRERIAEVCEVSRTFSFESCKYANILCSFQVRSSQHRQSRVKRRAAVYLQLQDRSIILRSIPRKHLGKFEDCFPEFNILNILKKTATSLRKYDF